MQHNFKKRFFFYFLLLLKLNKSLYISIIYIYLIHVRGCGAAVDIIYIYTLLTIIGVQCYIPDDLLRVRLLRVQSVVGCRARPEPRAKARFFDPFVLL